MKQTKIYAQTLDKTTMDQFNKAMALECNIQGALMPDAHAGYTLPIGAVIRSKDMIFPSYVGYDIGCGMCAVKLDIFKEDIDLNKLKSSILANIPLGREKFSTPRSYKPLASTKTAQRLYEKVGRFQLGTLGGGNHFIELGQGKDKKIWIVIHSGSRGFGKQIAEYYMRLAALRSTDTKKFEKDFESSNKEFKERNPKKFEEAKERYILKRSQKSIKGNLEDHYGFKLGTKDADDYILDMECALQFALDNRKKMIDTIKLFLGSPKELMFINRNHNHAELLKDGYIIHRKGATHADKGMYGVIPGNMKEGSFIVKGKGDPDSLCSSSHGAGRVMSRIEAKKSLDMEQFHKSMKGIVTNHNSSTIDEAPKAYKDIYEVMELQKDLVDVIDQVKPVLNIKG